MKLLTLKQYMKMSKPALIRKITKTLRAMPKAKLARLCYNITKSKLPRLPYEQTKTKMLRRYKKLKFTEEIPKRKRKLLNQSISPKSRYIDVVTADLIQRTPYVATKKKRKFSRKQLAAQRLFAKRARAGTLRRRRR